MMIWLDCRCQVLNEESNPTKNRSNRSDEDTDTLQNEEASNWIGNGHDHLHNIGNPANEEGNDSEDHDTAKRCRAVAGDVVHVYDPMRGWSDVNLYY